MDKKVKASHTCHIMRQLFIIYEDGTTTMFPLFYPHEKPDEFFPDESIFNKELDALFKRPKKPSYVQ